MEMRVNVLEIHLGESADLDELRKSAGRSIRVGDVVISEGNRLFIMLADVKPGGIEAFIARVAPQLERLGGVVKPSKEGADTITDSLYRRAKSLILPLQARYE